MKNNKYKILIIIIFVGIIIAFFRIGINHNSELTVSKNKKIDKVFYSILDYTEFNTKNDEIEYFSEEEEKEIIERNDKNDLVKFYVIKGIENRIERNLEKSTEYFQKAMDLLPEIKNKLLQIIINYEYSTSIFLEDPELSRKYYQKAIQIAEEKNYEETLIWLKYSRGVLLVSSENSEYLDESYTELNDALNLAKENHSTNSIIKIYYYIGLVYWNKNQPVLSVSSKIEAYDKLDKDDPENYYSLDYLATEIGADYLELGNYQSTIDYLTPIITRNSSYDGVNFNKAYASSNLFEAYVKLKDVENAERVLNDFFDYTEIIEDEVVREHTLILGDYYKATLELLKENPQEAEKNLQNFLEKWTPIKDDFMYFDYDINAEILEGKIRYAMGEYSVALEHHLKAEELYLTVENYYFEQQVNELLYNDYSKLGNYQKAFEYSEKNNEIQKENRNSNDAQYSQYLLNKFESDKKEEKISNLEKTNDITKLFSIFFVLIIVVSAVFIIVVLRKNKSIKQLSEKFKSLSVNDPLTNISNRRAMDEYLSNQWPELKAANTLVTFIMIDIDFFKKYNDNYGHPEGDEVLKKVAKCLKDSCRDSDFVARYGGEEFTIILKSIQPEDAQKVIERLRNNLEKLNIEHKYSDVADRVTLSIGMATLECGNLENYEQGIQTADGALYRAKKQRNTYYHVYKGHGLEQLLEEERAEEQGKNETQEENKK